MAGVETNKLEEVKAVVRELLAQGKYPSAREVARRLGITHVAVLKRIKTYGYNTWEDFVKAVIAEVTESKPKTKPNLEELFKRAAEEAARKLIDAGEVSFEELAKDAEVGVDELLEEVLEEPEWLLDGVLEEAKNIVETELAKVYGDAIDFFEDYFDFWGAFWDAQEEKLRKYVKEAVLRRKDKIRELIARELANP